MAETVDYGTELPEGYTLRPPPARAPTTAADTGLGAGLPPGYTLRPPPGLLEDTAKSFGSGVVKGIEGVPQLPGQAAELGGHGLRAVAAQPLKWLGEKTGWWDPSSIAASDEEFQAYQQKHGITPDKQAFDIGKAGQAIAGGIEKATGGAGSYEPQTGAGALAKRVGEFFPLVAGSPMAAAAKVGVGALGKAALTGVAESALPAAGSLYGEKIGEQLGHPVIGNIIGTVAGSVANPVIAAAAAPRVAPEVAAAAERAKVSMPLAAASEEPVGTVATGLAKVPGVGLPANYFAGRAEQQLGEAAKRTSTEVGATTATEAGETVKDLMSGWKTGSARAQVRQAYDAVDPMLAPNAFGPLTATGRTASDILTERAGAGLPQGPAVSAVERALQVPQGLSYQGMQRLRSDIGDKLADATPGTYEYKELTRMYGSLTQDIEQHIQQVGQPGALDAWNAANDVARDIGGRQRAVNKIIGVKEDASGALVADRIGSMATTGKGENIGRLNKAKSTVGYEDWQQIAASIAQNKWMDASGAFAPKQFIKWYDGLSEAGKDTLFGPAGQATGLTNLRQAYDDIAYLSRRLDAANLGGAGKLATSGGIAGELALVNLMPALASWLGVGGATLSTLLTRPVTASKFANLTRTYAEYTMAERAGQVSADLAKRLAAATTDFRNSMGQQGQQQ